MNTELSIRLLRNATLLISIAGKKILVDPMLGEKNEWDPIPWTNEIRNPTVDLPISEGELRTIINEADYILLTHLHPDHWDEAAKRLIPKEKTIICQPEDARELNAQGFSKLFTGAQLFFPSGLSINRVKAQHGHGEIAENMGPASGFVLKTKDTTLYLAGDTVWFEGVKNVIHSSQPDIIVVNAGSAKFKFGEPITMTAEDVLEVGRHSKEDAKVIVVHLEAINHCAMTREELKIFVEKNGISEKVIIPDDGEEVNLNVSHAMHNAY